jgi:hypothetical protein
MFEIKKMFLYWALFKFFFSIIFLQKYFQIIKVEVKNSLSDELKIYLKTVPTNSGSKKC